MVLRGGRTGISNRVTTYERAALKKWELSPKDGSAGASTVLLKYRVSFSAGVQGIPKFHQVMRSYLKCHQVILCFGIFGIPDHEWQYSESTNSTLNVIRAQRHRHHIRLGEGFLSKIHSCVYLETYKNASSNVCHPSTPTPSPVGHFCLDACIVQAKTQVSTKLIRAIAEEEWYWSWLFRTYRSGSFRVVIGPAGRSGGLEWTRGWTRWGTDHSLPSIDPLPSLLSRPFLAKSWLCHWGKAWGMWLGLAALKLTYCCRFNRLWKD